MTTARRTDFPDRPTGPARLLGWLPDGTAHYAPVGRLLVHGDRVCCHLCGRWFLSVASHLRVHGWTKDDYLNAFGLELSNTLAGEATHKRRAAAFAARQVHEPAIRHAQNAGRERARSGALAAAAAAANTGRAHPTQRRPKTLAALAAISPEARAAATAHRGQAHLTAVAASAAATLGFADFTSYALDRLAAGMSMAAISRESGVHKDWVSRHLARVAPAAARLPVQPHRGDLRWLPIIARLGFDDAATYLQVRHLQQHRTVRAIAVETGISRGSVQSALLRHGITPAAHAGKRHAAAQRDRAAAHRVGFTSLPAYVADRRAAGATWAALAAETGLPETTLHRRGPHPPTCETREGQSRD